MPRTRRPSQKPSRRRRAGEPLPGQLSLGQRGKRGGYRANAGRKAKPIDDRKGHWPRPHLAARFPVHVTLRVLPGVESLRRARCYDVLRVCFAAGNDRFGFRLNHFSVQGNHIHLICEAADRRALSRGMQGLAIRIARRLNRALGRRGRLFAQRFHARILRTPTEVHHALDYLYNNARHHARRPIGRGWVDPCTSVASFRGWRYPIRDMRLLAARPPVVPPRTWLLSEGWLQHGRIGPRGEPRPR